MTDRCRVRAFPQQLNRQVDTNDAVRAPFVPRCKLRGWDSCRGRPRPEQNGASLAGDDNFGSKFHYLPASKREKARLVLTGAKFVVRFPYHGERLSYI